MVTSIYDALVCKNDSALLFLFMVEGGQRLCPAGQLIIFVFVRSRGTFTPREKRLRIMQGIGLRFLQVGTAWLFAEGIDLARLPAWVGLSAGTWLGTVSASDLLLARQLRVPGLLVFH